jgi:hypothetical protein
MAKQLNTWNRSFATVKNGSRRVGGRRMQNAEGFSRPTADGCQLGWTWPKRSFRIDAVVHNIDRHLLIYVPR